MSTPERPSLADTLAHIDATLAGHAAKLDAQPPCLHCARQALRGSEFCAAHKRIPREMIEDLGPVEPVVDEATAEVLRIVQDDFARHEGEYLRGLQLDVRPRGGITENGKVLPWSPYLQPALDEAARQSAAQLAAADPWFNPRLAESSAASEPGPGWLARALHRLFT